MAPISLPIGTKADEKASDFPVPAASGIYWVRAGAFSETPIKKHPDIIRLRSNFTVVRDDKGNAVNAFAEWFIFVVPEGREAEFETYRPTQQRKRLRQLLINLIGAGALLDQLEQRGQKTANAEPSGWVGKEGWAHITVKDDTYDGETRRVATIDRFLTQADVDKANGIVANPPPPPPPQQQATQQAVQQQASVAAPPPSQQPAAQQPAAQQPAAQQPASSTPVGEEDDPLDIIANSQT